MPTNNSTQNILVFKIREDGIKTIRKRGFRRSLLVSIIAVASGTAMGYSGTTPKQLDMQTLLLCLVFGVFALGLGMVRGLKRQKLLLGSYRLTIAGDILVKEQENTPTIRLYKKAITSIVKNKNGSLLIKGENPADDIPVPSQVEQYQALENVLETIRPIEADNRSSINWVTENLMQFISIGLVICVFTANYKPVVASSGLALIAVITWSFVKTRTSKHVDDKTKRSMWWVVFILFLVVLNMVYKLAGMPHV